MSGWSEGPARMIFSCPAALLAVLLTVVPGLARGTNGGSFSVRVVNPGGSVVVSAKVSARNAATGQVFSAETDQNGGFKIVGIPGGACTVTVEAPGFKEHIRQLEQPVDLSVVLEPAGKDLDSLKLRVDELERQNRTLEAQNREIMRLLVELKSRLDTSPATVAAINLRPVELEAKNVISDSGIPITPKPAAGDSGVASTQGTAQSARWSELISDGNRFKIYGAMRLDVILDSQRPNSAQSPMFIPSGSGDANFTMHPRLTTVGIDYSGPAVSAAGEGRLSGKLEFDFQNGGAEFAPAPRILQAYLRMDWENGVFALGGQKWDTVSPIRPIVNDDSVMFTAGNTGLRRPQFLVGYEPKSEGVSVSVVGGIGLSGAVDSGDRDGNGIRDGEESGTPHFQARLGISGRSWVEGERASIGISGAYGFLATGSRVFGRTQFRPRLGNIDFTLPLWEYISLRGEAWVGSDISDFGGGAGQGFTFRPVRSRGGWAELGIKPSKYFSTHPGFTIDDPRDNDLFLNNITQNRAFYWANRFRPSESLLIGIDYLRWKTNFRGLHRGLNNRLNLIFQYSF